MDLRNSDKMTRNLAYITSMKPLLNKRGFFTDMTGDYVIPPEPNPYGIVRIRFRTKKDNVDTIYLVTQQERYLMYRAESGDEFDYYECTLHLDENRVDYYFQIISGKVICYYDRRGVVREVQDYYRFTLIPGLKTPDWAKGAVMYQIYVDRFCKGDSSNDVLTDEYSYIGEHVNHVDDWGKYPATMGVREFYGGDLQGVLDKMDYLQDLGVDVIYFNPLFVSPSNHKYDIQDYDNIDPHIGKIVDDQGDLLEPWQNENRFATRYINRIANKKNLDASNELFRQLVEEAHKRGMKVILDGVFNHCGSFNKWLDRERIYENFEGYEKGAYVDKESKYHNFFKFYEDRWPYNHTYDGWWGHDTLPKLNYEQSRELYEYILYIGKKWVSPPYNVDGWRLDVAADLGHSSEMNHQFWKDFRRAVREANPNAIVLAEHYGCAKEWIENGEWDTVMNYDAFMEPLTWFLTGMQKHSDDYREDLYGNAESFFNAMTHHSVAFTNSALQIAMNELSNHDHSRFLTRTNKRVGRVNTMGPEAANEGVNKAVLREAVVVQMTWPGAPTIYYGDEAGVCGFTDPDNRRTYPWGKEDMALIDFHKAAIKMHKEHKEFLTGSIKYLISDYNVIGYGRFNQKAQNVILVNNNDYEITKEIPVWELGVPRECTMFSLLQSTADGFTTDPVEYQVRAGEITVTLPKTSAIVIHYSNPDVAENEFGQNKTKNFLHFT